MEEEKEMLTDASIISDKPEDPLFKITDEEINSNYKLKHETVEPTSYETIGSLSLHPCIDCGEKDILVLDFDHLENKDEGISWLVHNNKKLETVQQEITKCVVRCANCHRRKTAKDFNHLRYQLLQERNLNENRRL